MVASILASESRGGLLAACVGTVVVAMLGVQGMRQRAAAMAALVLVFAGGIALRQAVQPPPPTFTSTIAPADARADANADSEDDSQHRAAERRPGNRQGRQGLTKRSKHHTPAPAPKPLVRVRTAQLPQEQDEIGHPALTKRATTTLASGRIAAWEGVPRADRRPPILGYGFGTEQKVFIDRWYYFQGGTPRTRTSASCSSSAWSGWRWCSRWARPHLRRLPRAPLPEGDDRILVVAGLGVVLPRRRSC